MRDRLDLWTGKFGDDYHARQNFTDKDLAARSFFWQCVMSQIKQAGLGLPKSILEVGAGTGMNLRALEPLGARMAAVEPNRGARGVLSAIFPIPKLIIWDHEHTEGVRPWGPADFVFTMGVLIHIPKAGLPGMMHDIYHASNEFIFCAEYFSPEERTIPYRGVAQALWTRDYGSLWMDAYPDLKCLAYGFSWKRLSGLDNLTWWLMRKERKDEVAASNDPRSDLQTEAAA